MQIASVAQSTVRNFSSNKALCLSSTQAHWKCVRNSLGTSCK